MKRIIIEEPTPVYDEKGNIKYFQDDEYVYIPRKSKPEDRFEEAREKYQVEWSEEDEKIRQSIIKDIEFERNYTLAETGRVSEKYNEQINWLKILSLNRKKINEGVEKLCSNEWSDEDERIRKELIGMVKFHCADEHLDRYLNYLEKQKEQKPEEWSEEDKPIPQEEFDAAKHESLWGEQKPAGWKQGKRIEVGNKVKIHCREDRNKDMLSIYNDKVGEVISIWDAQRNPWGPIIVRLDNGCNNGFHEDELEVLDKPSWKPSEEQIHAIIEALKYLPNNKDEWMILNTLVDVFKKLM